MEKANLKGINSKIKETQTKSQRKIFSGQRTTESLTAMRNKLVGQAS